MSPLKPRNCPDFLRRAITKQVAAALEEDEADRDVTVTAIPTGTVVTAKVISREDGVLAGVFWFNETFAQLDQAVQVHWQIHDGDPIKKNTSLCTLLGDAKNILRGERCALNFLQLLSGTATATARLVTRAQRKIIVKDTRKTLPGLRLAQKYAVVCGGGVNHRTSLADAVLLKDNHIQACGSIEAAMKAVRQANPGARVEVEVTSLQQVKTALAMKADTIMLDNLNGKQIAQAIATIAGKARVEISGGVCENNIADLAESGADYVSSGALTKHVHALDLSMQLQGRVKPEVSA